MNTAERYNVFYDRNLRNDSVHNCQIDIIYYNNINFFSLVSY